MNETNYRLRFANFPTIENWSFFLISVTIGQRKSFSFMFDRSFLHPSEKSPRKKILLFGRCFVECACSIMAVTSSNEFLFQDPFFSGNVLQAYTKRHGNAHTVFQVGFLEHIFKRITEYVSGLCLQCLKDHPTRKNLNWFGEEFGHCYKNNYEAVNKISGNLKKALHYTV